MKLATRDLTAGYRRYEPPVLRSVSMAVPMGELYAVLGPNGSGKSTLMRALLGVIQPSSGQVQIGGRPLSDWSRAELAKKVGVVSQFEDMPFPMTVRELVAMGRYPHLGPLRSEGPADREAVQRALEECDTQDLANRLATRLSGGELQRVRIARALAQEPDALVLDEPTASLDIRHEMGIFQLLRRAANQGRTVVLITHNLTLAARFADRILLLDRGAVAGEGTPLEVLRKETVEQVYGWPVDVSRHPRTGALQVTPLSDLGDLPSDSTSSRNRR